MTGQEVTMGHYHDLLNELADPTKSLRTAIPDAWAGFAQLHRGALGEGALPPAGGGS